MSDNPPDEERILDRVAQGAPESPPAVIEMVVWLSRLSKTHESVVARLNEQHGLLRSETGVLFALWVMNETEGVRPSVLANALEQTTGGMTATLRRLVEAGLIERVADPSDGRVLLARLTQQGKKVGLESFVGMVQWHETAFGGFDEQRQAVILTVLQDLFAAIDGRRDLT